MSNTVIKVEGISKKYRLGSIGTGTLSHDLNQWWAQLRGRSNPNSSVDEAHSPVKKGDFWALQDLNFTVSQGDTLGIIGRNGAGKSTILKILSRVTSPTSGKIKIRGRIASLLEVGTGFHYELTGRENIFLNGAILGMTKREIERKLDEIIAFSGVEQHIDTPVKRYSSGMLVRLAFAVAAHLEPEILIVDEVLAVGDAEFQKKCLGKMTEVAGQGRTILFVSHNMQAVTSLCEKALWLEKGKVKESGHAHAVIAGYINNYKQHNLKQTWKDPATAPGNTRIRFLEIEIIPQLDATGIMDIRVPLTIKFRMLNFRTNVRLNIELLLYSYAGECIFDVPSLSKVYTTGVIEGTCTIPGQFLNDGSYYITLYVMEDTTTIVYELAECLSFELEDYRGETKYFDKWWGVVRPSFPFKVEQVSLQEPNTK
ncbi:MAG: ABC transporter ATP-binding protein [Chitinophagaceae bacterium]